MSRLADRLRSTASALLPIAAAIGLSSTSASAQEQEVVLAGYGGSIEQFMRDNTIPFCEEQIGAKINYVVGTALSNYTQVLAMRDKPEVDVYWSNDLTHVAGKQQGLYEKLDPAIVTNLEDVFERARDADGIGVASYVSSLGLQYNKEKFEEAGLEPPTSWYDLWREDLKGKVALYSFGIAFSQDLVALMAHLETGDQSNARAAIDKIKELQDIGNVAVIANTPAEMDNIMVQGQAWVTYNVGLRALLVEDRGAPLTYVHPKEGGVRFGNFYNVVKGAPNEEGAQKLVNCLISQEVQRKASEGLYVAPINRLSGLPDNLQGRVPYGDDELAALIETDKALMNEKLEEWADLWNREIESR